MKSLRLVTIEFQDPLPFKVGDDVIVSKDEIDSDDDDMVTNHAIDYRLGTVVKMSIGKKEGGEMKRTMFVVLLAGAITAAGAVVKRKIRRYRR